MNPALIASNGLAAIRKRHPMVHHITNSVVMNFTANVTLCMGAAPVMAPCIDESPEMVQFAGALLLNIGTLNPTLIDSMITAGKKANELSIPIVLDPVGAGATKLRTDSANRIISELEISIVRGNAGEILALAGEYGKVRGVDSTDTIDDRVEMISSLAFETGWVIAVTGSTDFVTDGTRMIEINNGNPIMGRVTGTGCAATTAAACYAAVLEDRFEAAAGALISFGIAGECAAEKCKGPGTFVPELLDALACLDEETITRMTRAEVLI
ncbi:MAG: hydroxyethylthiazole kinase [Candidatus Fermentibacteraceae bacterium]|nr:hydroxyethylthiazole kinase [Candidatus Fermentibacteraceae bacterium]